jgi:hypothetical protein
LKTRHCVSLLESQNLELVHTLKFLEEIISIFFCEDMLEHCAQVYDEASVKSSDVGREPSVCLVG